MWKTRNFIQITSSEMTNFIRWSDSRRLPLILTWKRFSSTFLILTFNNNLLLSNFTLPSGWKKFLEPPQDSFKTFRKVEQFQVKKSSANPKMFYFIYSRKFLSTSFDSFCLSLNQSDFSSWINWESKKKNFPQWRKKIAQILVKQIDGENVSFGV